MFKVEFTFFLEIEESDYLKCYQEKMTTIFNNFQV